MIPLILKMKIANLLFFSDNLMLYFKKTGRPIIGSDSSDEDVISDLEDSDEGFGFINEGNLSKRINALCHHYLISMQPYLRVA
jgi:hypothetical protein